MPESIILIPILKESVLKCTARDADTNVTDAAAQVRRGATTGRHTVRSGHDTMRIHEQPLPIRERDGGSVMTA